MTAIIMNKTKKAMDYFVYALYAFGGLGLEILLLMLEANIYGSAYTGWSAAQHIMHWIITCIVWGGIGLWLAKELPEKKQKIEVCHWLAGGVIFAVSIVSTSVVWEGFKPVIEFSDMGALKFTMQYLYYGFESLLIILIIAHGQEAFEHWFTNTTWIPFGGILLAVTWGLIHIFTQGSATGLYTVIQALLYGSMYMVLKRNFKVSYVAILFMFML